MSNDERAVATSVDEDHGASPPVAPDAAVDDRPVLGSGVSVRELLSIPAATAIALGLIYALGALLRSIELAKSGVPASEAFPQIPIEQLLGSGLAVVTQPAIVVVGGRAIVKSCGSTA